jgi:peptidoglycan hydrolase-like protein with peptidoglycan-binding domain
MNGPVLSAVAVALGLCFATVWTDSAFADRRVALVIGNSAYQNAPALANPTSDAEAVAAKFKEAGFAVVSAHNDLGNLPFKRAIRQFEDAAVDADIVVVFYAGHGIEVRGVNYMIPVDAKLASDRDAEDEAITLDRLLQAVEGARRLGLVILDACRDNPFVRNMKRSRTAALRAITPGLGAVEPSTSNTLVAYAAKAGTGAEDGLGNHSPFTTALMKHLFVKGLDIRLAFGRIRDEVLKTTRGRQEPFVYGSIGGESISVVPAAAQAALATDDPQGERADYQLVEKIGTKRAWEVFLVQHPKGFYAELARQQMDKLAALEPPKPPPAPTPSSEERRVWDRIKDTSNAVQYREFIKRYPSSPLANTARNRLEALEQEMREREEKVRLEREAKAAEAARQQAEREERARAEREAKAAEAARQQAEREAKAAEAERQKAEREAAAKRAEEERIVKLSEAARAKQEEAARQQAAREEKVRAEREARAAEAARERAEREARAAEAARQRAEREAAAKRAEEERTAKLAEAARAKQDEAARQQAEREAREAEAERQRAEREAATKRGEEERIAKLREEAPATQQDACGREQGLLDALTAAGNQGWAREDLKRLEQRLTCEHLRPKVIAALEAVEPGRKPLGLTIEAPKPASNTPELVRSAQKELARIGCFTGDVDGILGDVTTTAIKRYQAERGRRAAEIEITDRFVSELMDQSSRICPLVCPTGKIAEGEQCVAARPPAPAARQKDVSEDERSGSRQKAKQESKSKAVARQKDTGEDRRSRARQQEPRPQRARQEEAKPQTRIRQEAKSSAPRYSSGGGGGHGPTIGVGF